MTSSNRPEGKDRTTGKDRCSPGGKATPSVTSEARERHFLDDLEDDEVREALQLSRQPPKGAISTK